METKFCCDDALKETIVSDVVNSMKEGSAEFAECLEVSGEALDMKRFLIDYELIIKRAVREASDACTDKDDFRDRLFKLITNNTSHLILTSLVEAPDRALSEDELEACMPGKTSDGTYTLIGYIEHVSPEIDHNKAKEIAKEISALIGERIGQFLSDMRGPDALVIITNRMVSTATRMDIDNTLVKYAITPIFSQRCEKEA